MKKEAQIIPREMLWQCDKRLKNHSFAVPAPKDQTEMVHTGVDNVNNKCSW